MMWIWQLAFLCLAVGERRKLIRIPLFSSRQCLEYNSPLKLNVFGMVGIGDPPQYFRMLFDISSSFSWVFSKNCSSENCPQRHRYDSSLSRKHRKIGKKFILDYKSSKVSGFLSQDSIKIADVDFPDQIFLEVTGLTNPNFIYKGYDGIVGLGMNSAGELTSLLRYMVNKGIIHKPRSSIFLKKYPNCFGELQSGEIVLGNPDLLYYSSLMNNFPIPGNGKWQFRLLRVRDNDLVFCENVCWGSISSTYPYIGFPIGAFNYILKKVGVTRVGEEFLFDCSKISLFPSLKFDAPGVTFTLERSDYIFKEKRNGSLVCVAGLHEYNHFGDYTFTLGSIFIRKYYTEFDFQSNMIGIGIAKQMHIILL